MANRTNSKIIYVDLFDADVTIAEEGRDFIVRKIRCISAADGDIFRLEDSVGNRLLHMVNLGANDAFEVDFGDKGYNFGNKGIVIDVSDCTGMAATDGTDAVWIYLC